MRLKRRRAIWERAPGEPRTESP
ncbi:MAG: hypothetical protein HW377_733, partial [Actinobacteria bacterium]|nr:hypothetical protein [Actinomycetota bacterium]